MERSDGHELASPRLFSFVVSDVGEWTVASNTAVIGEPLDDVLRLSVVAGDVETAAHVAWTLRGVTSNGRYTTGEEQRMLAARQEALGRPAATMAALIPIAKHAAWWDLPHDERRAILEERSRHIAIGAEYLPGIARRLHHCRDLGSAAPFDFLTWFEFAPADEAAFDDLVGRLRGTEEWQYVTREVDVRLTR